MITIGIYDKNKESSNYLYETIHKIMLCISNWQLQVYNHKNEIEELLSEGAFTCQLLFLSMDESEAESGDTLSFVRSICQNAPDTDIIFVSDSMKNVYEYSSMHTFAYILKPVTHDDITNELTRYLENIHYPMKMLEISFQKKTHKIPVDSILYIESDLRKLIIHTPKKLYYSYGKLSEMEEELKEDGFIRCHKSYLVALDKVMRYSSSKLYINEEEIPVSKAHQSYILAHFEKYGIPDRKFQKRNISYNQTHSNYGILVCTTGLYTGAIIRIKPEQTILIGRNGNSADIIINLPDVSRIHCSLLYHHASMTYEVCDMSKNGTFVNNKRLLHGESYQIPKGSYISFGQNDTVYRLA